VEADRVPQHPAAALQSPGRPLQGQNVHLWWRVCDPGPVPPLPVCVYICVCMCVCVLAPSFVCIKTCDILYDMLLMVNCLYCRDLWSLDLKTNAWTEIRATGDCPSARYIYNSAVAGSFGRKV
jgi:hypothetical protein